MYSLSNNSFLTSREESYSLNGRLDFSSNRSSRNDASATHQLFKQLAKHVPGMRDADAFAGLKRGDFAPEKVAERLSAFVEKGLAQARLQGGSETAVADLYDKALSGIQKGFEAAAAKLEKRGLLSDEVAANIDQTYALTMQGLEQLAPTASTEPQLRTSTTNLMAAERYELAESFSLAVETRDGDLVTIDFSHDSSYQASLGAYSDDQASAVSFSLDRSENSNFRFSVEGELDEEELDALQDLVKDISQAADEFFDGDIQEAFAEVKELDFDGAQLASMNLSLSRTETYSAVSAYEQVQSLESADQGRGRKLGHLMNDLAGRLSHPNHGFLESPQQFGQDLLSQLIPQDSRYLEAEAEQQDRFAESLQTMKDLLSSLENWYELDD